MEEAIQYFDVPLLVAEKVDPGFIVPILTGWLLKCLILSVLLVAAWFFLKRHTPRLERGPVTARFLFIRLLRDRGFFPIFGIALVLRLIGYNSNSLYSQEATYMSELYWGSENPFLFFIKPAGLMNLHPPLFSFLLGILKQISPSEYLLRLPSVLCGALSVGLTWKLAGRLFGQIPALLCAFAMVISPMDLFYSQRLLPYSWALMFAVLSLLLLERYLNGPESCRIGYLWWIIPVNILGFYCHMSYLVFVITPLLASAWIS